jgi:phospholipase C
MDIVPYPREGSIEAEQLDHLPVSRILHARHSISDILVPMILYLHVMKL